jgi:endonuclease YncB( thermonuclease family)
MAEPMPAFRLACSTAALLASLLAGPAIAETISGPVEAEVIRVIDGDTLALRARIWPGLEVTVNARIRGIDTPEINGSCDREKLLAEAARLRLIEATSAGRVRLSRIEHDKYAGRVLADIVTDDGRDLAAAMLESGLARPYDGGGREPWCGIASLGG